MNCNLLRQKDTFVSQKKWLAESTSDPVTLTELTADKSKANRNQANVKGIHSNYLFPLKVLGLDFFAAVLLVKGSA
jgi:hypothetical protein